MTNERAWYFPMESIMSEFEEVMRSNLSYDAVTVVGEGEPTLYAGLGRLIEDIRKKTTKPIAVITNGALLYEQKVREDLQYADIVLPTMDAYNESSFRKINRPHRELDFKEVQWGLEEFSRNYNGKLWVEIMLIRGFNDDDFSLKRYKEMLHKIHFDKIYLNTPVRPPAEACARPVESDRMQYASKMLGAIAIDMLAQEGFQSEIGDDYKALMSIIRRHPMNQFEIASFLEGRNTSDPQKILDKMDNDDKIVCLKYRGYLTYRMKMGD